MDFVPWGHIDGNIVAHLCGPQFCSELILHLSLAHRWLPEADEGIIKKILFAFRRGPDLAEVQESPLRSSFPLLPSLTRGGYYQFHHFSHEIGNLGLLILLFLLSAN